MNTPTIATAARHPVALQPLFAEAGVEAFTIVRSGYFAGRDWSAGDMIVCSPRREAVANVVLIPRGRGRIRMGTAQGSKLFGEAGEPCSPARWRAAGMLSAVARPARGAGWVVEQLNTPNQPQTHQLSLFAA